MSMELFVLSDRPLESIAEWQQAITAAGFSLTLPAETPFEALDGFLPVQLGERSTGFECSHWDANEVMAECPEIDFGRRWRHALSFRWGGADPYQSPAVFMAGAAYAGATDGVVLDWEQGELLTPQQAAENARVLEKEAPQTAEMVRLLVQRIEAEHAEKLRDKDSKK